MADVVAAGKGVVDHLPLEAGNGLQMGVLGAEMKGDCETWRSEPHGVGGPPALLVALPPGDENDDDDDVDDDDDNDEDE